MLERALEFAAEHSATLGRNAREYVGREHSLPRVADDYVAALEIAAGGDDVNDEILMQIATAAALEEGIDIAALARAARDSGILL